MPSQDMYDLAENQLKAFTRSAVRTRIMLHLARGEMTFGELEDDIGIRGSTILHSMKDLVEHNIAKKTRKGYALTNIGMIEALLLDELIGGIVILDQHKEFWLSHDLSGMPLPLLAKIGMLAKSEILKGDPAAILKSHEHFISELMGSKEISGVSPVILPDYPETIAKLVIEKKSKVRLIVTEDLLGKMIQDHQKLLKELLGNENFELYAVDMDLKTAFTVTDKVISLGFFRIDGSYDVGTDLICEGETAREWGLELFNYYLKMSNPIKTGSTRFLMGKIY